MATLCSYICRFLHYFHHMMLVNVNLELYFKVEDFIRLVNFEWHKKRS